MFTPRRPLSALPSPASQAAPSSTPDLYWYEYQATEPDPARARPLRFTGLRTTFDLSPLGTPISLLGRLSPDILPSPAHCLATRLTPTDTYQAGLTEPALADAIALELHRPNLCAIGIGPAFVDEELTRYLMYRNFRPIYGRDHRPGQSRFGFQGMLNLARVLFPSTLTWPSPASSSLLDLAVSNGFSCPPPSQVARLQAAKFLFGLVRTRQPDFFAELFSLRQVDQLRAALEACLLGHEPFVLADDEPLSGKFSLLLPWFFLDADRSLLVAVDQVSDCAKLLKATPAALAASFSSHTFFQDFPTVRVINLNRSPALLPVRWIVHHQTEHLPVDWLSVFRHTKQLCTSQSTKETVQAAFAQHFMIDFASRPGLDPELRLYEKFPEPFLARQLSLVLQTPPADLSNIKFGSPKYDALLFRYRARNFYWTLTTSEKQLWLDFCRQRLTADALAEPFSWARFDAELATHGHSLGRSLFNKLSLWASYSRQVFALSQASPR